MGNGANLLEKYRVHVYLFPFFLPCSDPSGLVPSVRGAPSLGGGGRLVHRVEDPIGPADDETSAAAASACGFVNR